MSMHRRTSQNSKLRSDDRVPSAEQRSCPAVVSPAGAAAIAGVGRTFIYTALKIGALKSSKIGSRRLIKLSAIDEWLAAHEDQRISNQS
jgi:excisionase family DNA binding protein